jgi:hypothetical protein
VSETGIKEIDMQFEPVKATREMRRVRPDGMEWARKTPPTRVFPAAAIFQIAFWLKKSDVCVRGRRPDFFTLKHELDTKTGLGRGVSQTFLTRISRLFTLSRRRTGTHGLRAGRLAGGGRAWLGIPRLAAGLGARRRSARSQTPVRPLQRPIPVEPQISAAKTWRPWKITPTWITTSALSTAELLGRSSS